MVTNHKVLEKLYFSSLIKIIQNRYKCFRGIYY
jgi:hypothetical protein